MKAGGKKKIREEPSIEIQNVVASASLEHGIDIEAICKAFPKAEYRPEVFPGLVFRLKKPKTATLIFGSGKMVCTGGKTARDTTRAIEKIVRMLKSKGIIIKGRPKIQIQNVVASANIHGKVDLVSFYIESGEEKGGGVMYEPEQFPGLIYRMRRPRSVILVFSSGKLVCTGAKREMDIPRAIEKIRGKLEEYGAVTYDKPQETSEREPVIGVVKSGQRF